MSDDAELSQSDIEALLNQPQGDTPAPTPDGPAPDGPAPDGPAPDGPAPDESALEGPEGADDAMGQDEIEALLHGGGASAPESRTATPPAAGDEDKLLAQEDIEKLLDQAGKGGAAAQPETPPAPTPPVPDGAGAMAQKDVEYLLEQAEEALDSIIDADASESPAGVDPFEFEEFGGAPASTETATLDLIRDVDLDVKIELGRTNMYIEDLLKLKRGSVVPLDKLAGDPVDIFVNGRLIARGEVLVLNDNFCVRVAELVAGQNACA